MASLSTLVTPVGADGVGIGADNFLATLLTMEQARHAVYRPVDARTFGEGASARPMAYLSYTLSSTRHFPFNAGADPIMPHRWADANMSAAPLLFTATNAVAHMNGLKGQKPPGGKPPVVVRTFVERLRGETPELTDVCMGLRLHHIVYPNTAAAAAAAAAAASKNKKEGEGSGSDDSDVDSDDEAMEISGDDEEAIIRAERRAAAKEKREANKKDKAAATQGAAAAQPIREQRAATFAGGFEASLKEAATYDQRKKEMQAKEAAKVEYARKENEVAPRHLQFVDRERQKVEAIFRVQTVSEQYMNVLVGFLRADTRQRIGQDALTGLLGEGDSFTDQRTCVDHAIGGAGVAPYDAYSAHRGRIDPDVVLGFASTMAYHTRGVCEEQRNLLNYVEFSEAQLDAVIALHAKNSNTTVDALMGGGGYESGSDGGDHQAIAGVDIFGASDEQLERIRGASIKQKYDLITELFTRHPDRIAYMEAARPRPQDFKGFAFSSDVYEVDRALVRPEVVWRLPLPQIAGTVLSPGAKYLTDQAHLDYIGNLIRASQVVSENLQGRKCAKPMDMRVAREMFARRSAIQYTAIERATHDIAADKESHGGRFLTPKTLLHVLHEAAQVCHTYGRAVKARADLEMSFFIARNFDTLVDAAKDGITFLKTVTDRYHALREVQEQRSAGGTVDSTLARDTANLHVVEGIEEAVAAVDLAQGDGEDDSLGDPDADGGAARLANQHDIFSRMGDNLNTERGIYGTIFLGKVPTEIIERDDALKLNIDNSRKYAQLSYEATHGEGMSKEVYEARMWQTVCDAAQAAHTLFFEGTNLSQNVIKNREWFLQLSEEEKNVEFRMPYEVRPYTAFRMWLNESLASPVLNLSQNTTAMTIAYFSSLHHCRWYERNRDPKLNFLMAGDGASGKSFILHAIEEVSPAGTFQALTHMSTHSLHVKRNLDGMGYIFHEFQHRYLFPPNPMGNDDGGSGGDAINFFKDRLTRGIISVSSLSFDKKTKERTVDSFEASCQGVTLGATNNGLSRADPNVISRFIVFSVPKPRDMAEGTHPVDRVDVDDLDVGRKLAVDHFAPRTKRAHQLLRFRYAYSEFMVKCGVLPNGMQTFGGRVAIDNVLNRMHDDFSVDTRDPRKRKMTEEMARVMALLFGNYMGLGSPLAKVYKERNRDGDDLYSWKAWLYCVVPFMFVGKDAVIDALTLLEAIWAPQYLTRILYTTVFDVVTLHEYPDDAFRSTHRAVGAIAPGAAESGEMDLDGLTPAHADDEEKGGAHHPQQHHNPHKGRGTHGGPKGVEMERIVDYNYVCIRGPSRSAIHERIADACSRFGVRKEDVEEFFQKLTRQYIPTHRLVRRNPMLSVGAIPGEKAPAAPSVPATHPAIPKAFTHHATAAAAANKDLAEALSNITTQGFPAAPPEASEDSEWANAMDRALDARMSQAPAPAPEPATIPPPGPQGGKTFYGTDRVHIGYDETSNPIRIPVVKYEKSSTRGGVMLSISTRYLEDRLKFDISTPQTLRDARAKERTRPNPIMPSVPVTPGVEGTINPATGRPIRWGIEADANFVQRMAKARSMCNAALDTTSPILKCIQAVFSNAHLEQPDEEDLDAQAVMRLLTQEYDQAFAADTNPSKRKMYPWMNFITSIPVADYVMESMDKKRFPEGRRVTFHDMLKTMPLERDASNEVPIHRNNYASLSLYSRDIINFRPTRGLAHDMEEDDVKARAQRHGAFASASYRNRVMNTARGIRYVTDIDYREAVERMDSICHPGCDLFRLPRLIGWAPVTYMNVRAIDSGLTSAGLYKKYEDLHEDPESIAHEFGFFQTTTEGTAAAAARARWSYPELDPTLKREYPTHQIVHRVRLFEEMDRNEANKSHMHLTRDDHYYGSGIVRGGIVFMTADDANRLHEARERQKTKEKAIAERMVALAGTPVSMPASVASNHPQPLSASTENSSSQGGFTFAQGDAISSMINSAMVARKHVGAALTKADAIAAAREKKKQQKQQKQQQQRDKNPSISRSSSFTGSSSSPSPSETLRLPDLGGGMKRTFDTMMSIFGDTSRGPDSPDAKRARQDGHADNPPGDFSDILGSFSAETNVGGGAAPKKKTLDMVSLFCDDA